VLKKYLKIGLAAIYRTVWEIFKELIPMIAPIYPDKKIS
jgi:hypothetical protein